MATQSQTSSTCRIQTARFVDTRIHNPGDASNDFVEVTDPREPLYGKRFRIESVSRVEQEIAHVFDALFSGYSLASNNPVSKGRHSRA